MFEKEIARGVEVLNEHGPVEWWNQVEVGRLFMASRTQCVLGQLYGDYDDGLADLGLMTETESESCGFSTQWEKYLELSCSWRDEIDKIRAEVAA